MSRNVFFTVFALLVAVLFAAPSFAHGGHAQAPAAQVAPGDSSAAAKRAAFEPAASIATDGSHVPGHDCPAPEGACCTAHCCATGGLSIDAQARAPVFASTKMTIASDRPPPDAGADGHLRPPCR